MGNGFLTNDFNRCQAKYWDHREGYYPIFCNIYHDFDTDVVYCSRIWLFDNPNEDFIYFRSMLQSGINKFIFDISDYQTAEELFYFYCRIDDDINEGFYKPIHSFYNRGFEDFQISYVIYQNSLELFE